MCGYSILKHVLVIIILLQVLSLYLLTKWKIWSPFLITLSFGPMSYAFQVYWFNLLHSIQHPHVSSLLSPAQFTKERKWQVKVPWLWWLGMMLTLSMLKFDSNFVRKFNPQNSFILILLLILSPSRFNCSENLAMAFLFFSYSMDPLGSLKMQSASPSQSARLWPICTS